MKYLKHLSIALLISLLLSLVSCNLKGFDDITTSDTMQQTEFTWETDVCTGCWVIPEYRFNSYYEFEKYMSHGVTDDLQYTVSGPSNSGPPPHPDVFNGKYIPLTDLFNCSEGFLNSTKYVDFQYSPERTSAGFEYLFPDFSIMIESEVSYSSYSSVLDLYSEHGTYENFSYDISDMGKFDECAIIRKVNDTEVIWGIYNGKIHGVDFLYGGHLISITIKNPDDPLITSKILSSPFAPLFSTDDEKLSQAVTRIIEAIDAKEAESAANT